MLKSNDICQKIENNGKSIGNFYYTDKAKDFNTLINYLYLPIDNFDSTIKDSDWNDFVFNESKLRSVIQEDYLPMLKKYCDLDNSFFQSKVDLN